MKRIGYMRVSTDEQNNALQLDALQKYGCEKIFQDKLSGKIASRKGINECMEFLEPGDVLVVWRLDRLGRKVSNIHSLVDTLSERGVNFVSLTESFDTSTAAGRAMFGMMVVFAQMEREVMQERVKAGLDVLRKLGKKLGPRFKYNDSVMDDIGQRYLDGQSQSSIAGDMGLSQPTVSRILAILRAREEANAG